MTHYYDHEAIKEAIKKAVEANPEGQNPMEGRMCLNRADDPEATTPRCIASQVHFDLTGKELEGNNASAILAALDHTYGLQGGPFLGGAKTTLSVAQSYFDRATIDGENWSDAYARFLQEIE